MSGVIDKAWIEARIAATKAAIVAYEGAILAVGTTGVQSYRLDTGQTAQTVTKADIGSMRIMLANMENRLSMLELKLCPVGTYQGRPSC